MRAFAPLIAMLCVATTAYADDTFLPPDGTKNVVFTSFLCDTKEQINDIATAIGPYDKFLEYHAKKNDKGQSTCVYGTFMGDVIKSDPLTADHFGDQSARMWAINVGPTLPGLWILQVVVHADPVPAKPVHVAPDVSA